jgi:hypothetical protein
VTGEGGFGAERAEEVGFAGEASPEPSQDGHAEEQEGFSSSLSTGFGG